MKLLFLGDFFFDYDFFPDDFIRICEYIQNHDYKVVLNLEGAIGEGGSPIKKRGANLRHSNQIIEALKKLNVIAVCLANNHMMDFGREPFLLGLEKLDNAKILHVGAGRNLEDAGMPLSISDKMNKIILLNYGWDVEETVCATKTTAGCNPLFPSYIIQNTEEVRKENPDSIIVNIFHWGFEFNTLPMPRDIELAHRCIEVGSNLVIGHHPHVMQPQEKYRSQQVYYSLGNFYFSSRREKFSTVFKNEPHEHMCDYGLGVVFDTDSNTTCHLSFVYDRTCKVSCIYEDCEDLTEITGLDWNNQEYVNYVKKHSMNYTPVLGTDEQMNQRMIKQLYFKYSVANKLRFIRNSQIGSSVYNFLKRQVKP